MIVDTPPITIAFLAGLLSFISPCVLPLVPAYISYMGARAAQQANGGSFAVAGGPTVAMSAPPVNVNRFALFTHGLLFVMGFMLVFVLFGLAVTMGLQMLGISSFDLQNSIARLGGLVIILFGLHVMGVTGWLLRWLTARTNIESGFGRLLQRIQGVLYADTRMRFNNRGHAGYAGSLLMGVVFAAGWTPCVGPIYGSILTVASTGSTANAAVLLTAYSFGLGFPFLLAALWLDRIRPLMRSIQKHMRAVEIASGLLLIIMGYLLYSNQLGEIAGRMTWLSDFSYNVEECTVGVAQGTIPLGDFPTCMRLGINYRYKPEQPAAQTSMLPASSSLLMWLADGRDLVVNGSSRPAAGT